MIDAAGTLMCFFRYVLGNHQADLDFLFGAVDLFVHFAAGKRWTRAHLRRSGRVWDGDQWSGDQGGRLLEQIDVLLADRVASARHHFRYFRLIQWSTEDY